MPDSLFDMACMLSKNISLIGLGKILFGDSGNLQIGNIELKLTFYGGGILDLAHDGFDAWTRHVGLMGSNVAGVLPRTAETLPTKRDPEVSLVGVHDLLV